MLRWTRWKLYASTNKERKLEMANLKSNYIIRKITF